MRFWDTSAIVCLCVIEPRSPAVRSLIGEDPGIVVWWATRTESVSALMRQVRANRLSAEDERRARQVLLSLAGAWTEVQPSETVREAAERLLAVHDLGAADAFQLSAALLWCQRRPSGMHFVTFDARVRHAAYREGFAVAPARL